MKQIGLKMNDQELKLLGKAHKMIEKEYGYKITRKQVLMMLICNHIAYGPRKEKV
jgi:hypothetical protein